MKRRLAGTKVRRLCGGLYARRVALRLTQEELAEKVGTSGAMVSRWENGTSCPNPRHLSQLASLFRTNPEVIKREVLRNWRRPSDGKVARALVAPTTLWERYEQLAAELKRDPGELAIEVLGDYVRLIEMDRKEAA